MSKPKGLCQGLTLKWVHDQLNGVQELVEVSAALETFGKCQEGLSLEHEQKVERVFQEVFAAFSDEFTGNFMLEKASANFGPSDLKQIKKNYPFEVQQLSSFTALPDDMIAGG